MDGKIISVDLSSRFGFLKKPDINEDIYLTYNCLHKPALLGILGAIIGLNGYSQAFEKNKNELPEYFKMLNKVKVGIQPINSKNGNFQKTIITYNNSVGYASKETGGNLIIKEQTLVKPAYRIFLLLNYENQEEKSLYENLTNRESVFIPYLGKNDFQLFWKKPTEYLYEEFKYNSSFMINTIFTKHKSIKEIRNKNKIGSMNLFESKTPFFSYFERLPIGFSEITKNYELEEFTFTNFSFPSDYEVENLYQLKDEKENTTITYLF